MRYRAMRAVAVSYLSLFVLAAASPAYSDDPRYPQGVYATINISDYIATHNLRPEGDDDKFKALYNSVLKNQAISGIALEVHWDWAQPRPPPAAPNLGYIDDAFARARASNKKIRLIVTAGFNSPKWLLDLITSCNPLFVPGAVKPARCGTVDFDYYAEKTDQDGSGHLTLPLPWNADYIDKWQAFLKALERKYGSDQTLVSITMAGPTAASPEMIMPNNYNTCPPNTPREQQPCKQRNGYFAEDMWNVLFQNPQNPYPTNTDAAFIDQWKSTIDFYKAHFQDITLIITPGTGTGFPSFQSGHPFMPTSGNAIYSPECQYSDSGGSTYVNGNVATRSCDAATTILSYFLGTFGGHRRDLMASQTSGMTAGEALGLGPVSPTTKGATGDVGVAGVRYLSWYSGFPSSGQRGIAGGAQFDFEFSGKTRQEQQREGCWLDQPNCRINPAQAAYNVLKSFFYGTAGAAAFGGPTVADDGKVYPTPRFLQVYNQDVLHAQKPTSCAQTIVDPVTQQTFKASAQDLLDAAQATLLGQNVSYPPPHKGC